MVIMKKCNACGLIKDESCFTRDSSKPDGLHGICKPCKQQYKRLWLLTNPDKKAKQLQMQRDWYDRQPKKMHNCITCGVEISSRGRCLSCRAKAKELSEIYVLRKQGLKRCRDCKETKPFSEYYAKGKNSFEPWCKECAKKHNSKKRTVRLSRIKQSSVLYENHLQKQRQASRKYLSTEHGRADAIARAISRREKEAGLGGSFSKDDVAFIYKQFNYRCFKCGSTKNKVIDHHYPLKNNEPLTIDNAVLLCSKCNGSSGKWYRNPEEFYKPCEMLVLAAVYSKRHKGLTGYGERC